LLYKSETIGADTFCNIPSFFLLCTTLLSVRSQLVLRYVTTFLSFHAVGYKVSLLNSKSVTLFFYLYNVSAPIVSDLYNKFMFGVDLADQKRMQYSTCRKSKKWYKYLFWVLF
jgi:hypothetical protein